MKRHKKLSGLALSPRLQLLVKKAVTSVSRIKNSYVYIMIGIGSLIWVLLKSGRKPSRIVYPCQKIAIANAKIFLVLPLLYLHKLIHYFKHN